MTKEHAAQAMTAVFVVTCRPIWEEDEAIFAKVGATQEAAEGAVMAEIREREKEPRFATFADLRKSGDYDIGIEKQKIAV